jgi:dolichol-phosphate mannosyltransferase
MMGVSIVTSTYNERENISELITSIRGVMEGREHEIIVVDDTSPDGTVEVARSLADVAITKIRKGQTKALATGISAARFPTIVTIDADLENDPAHIPRLLEGLGRFDIVIASRNRLPRFSERMFVLAIGKKLGVHDVLSNFRAFRKSTAESIRFGETETYGAEFLIRAWKAGYRIGEIQVELRRRRKPRLGNAITANAKILLALVRSIAIILTAH